METSELKPIQAIEHRKPLRRYVVLGHQDGYWIALQGFRSLRRALRGAMEGFHFFGNAQRYAKQLTASGLTTETKIRDSALSGPFHKGLLMLEEMMR